MLISTLLLPLTLIDGFSQFFANFGWLRKKGTFLRLQNIITKQMYLVLEYRCSTDNMRKYRTNHDKILCFNLEPFSFTNFSRIFPVLSVVLLISNVPLIFMSSSNFLGGFEFTLLIRGTLVRVWYLSGNFFFIFFVIFRRDFWAFLSIKIGFAWTWNSFSVPFFKLKICWKYRKLKTGHLKTLHYA